MEVLWEERRLLQESSLTRYNVCILTEDTEDYARWLCWRLVLSCVEDLSYPGTGW